MRTVFVAWTCTGRPCRELEPGVGESARAVSDRGHRLVVLGAPAVMARRRMWAAAACAGLLLVADPALARREWRLAVGTDPKAGAGSVELELQVPLRNEERLHGWRLLWATGAGVFTGGDDGRAAAAVADGHAGLGATRPAPWLDLGGARARLEAGMAIHLLSSDRMGSKEVSTHFQFCESLGLSWPVGTGRVAVGYEHISNGGVREPNPGLDLVRVGWVGSW